VVLILWEFLLSYNVKTLSVENSKHTQEKRALTLAAPAPWTAFFFFTFHKINFLPFKNNLNMQCNLV